MGVLVVNRKKKSSGSGPERRDAAGRANVLKFGRTAAVTHGITSVIRSGEIPPSVRDGEKIRVEVDQLMSEAVSDLGGESELTAQRKVILESERLALLVLKLAGAYLTRQGLMNRKTGRPHAVLNIAATYANSARLAAVSLGLSRVPRKVGPASLDEYLLQREVDEADAPAGLETTEVPESEQ